MFRALRSTPDGVLLFVAPGDNPRKWKTEFGTAPGNEWSHIGNLDTSPGMYYPKVLVMHVYHSLRSAPSGVVWFVA